MKDPITLDEWLAEPRPTVPPCAEFVGEGRYWPCYRCGWIRDEHPQPTVKPHGS